MLALWSWLKMGGYAAYVWSSYGLVLSGLIGIVRYIHVTERNVLNMARSEMKNKYASCS